MRLNQVLGLALSALTLSATTSFSASYQAKTFPDGTVWWVFDGEVKTAVRMNSLKGESVDDFGEFIVLLDDESELDNLAGMRKSAHDMTEFLLTVCQDFETPCNVYGPENRFQRKTAVVLTDQTASSQDGRIPEDEQIVKAFLTWSCYEDCKEFGDLDFDITFSDNALTERMFDVKARENDRNVQAYLRSEEGQKILESDSKAAQTEDDERLVQAFSKAMDGAKPLGFLQSWFAGPETQVIGAWAGSTEECSESLLTLAQVDDGQTLYFWIFDSGIPVPVLTGNWEVSENAVIMTFKAAMTTRSLTSLQPIDVAQQLDIVSVNDDSLRLGIPGGQKPQRNWAQRLLGSTSVLDLLMKDSAERQFVRCDNAFIQNGLEAS